MSMQQRKFIFLEAIDGYSVNTRNLKGHTQIDEIKNKIVIKLFIEGLDNEEYGVDVLMNQSITMNIGSFYGQNKSENNFYLSNGIKEISAIVVYPMKDKKNIVLVGYLKDKEKINIKEIAYLIENKQIQKNNSETKEVISNQEPLVIIQDTNLGKIEEAEENESLKKPIEENIIEDFKSTGYQEVIEEIIFEDEVKNQLTDVPEDRGGIYNNQIFYLWENIEKLDSYLEPAFPFIQAIPKHKWWLIKEQNTEIQYYCILYNGYLMPMIYPFMNYKNISIVEKDWVFGTVTEQYGEKEVLKYFVYGIPGRFTMQEQPFKGSTGYLYWQSCDVVKIDSMGYWLLYVDVHTGKIVIPRRPVKPPLNKNIMHNNM